MSQPIPRDVVAVEHCTCSGSLDLHLVTCAIHDVTEDQYRAAVGAARARLGDYLERFNGKP